MARLHRLRPGTLNHITQVSIPASRYLTRCISGVPTLAADYQRDLRELQLPPAESSLPRASEAARLREQNNKHFIGNVEQVKNAIWAIDPTLSGRGISEVARSVVEAAVATLPPAMQPDAHKAYERVMVHQRMAYSLPSKTTAHKLASIESGKKHQVVLDCRHVSITGTATLSSGEQLQFPDSTDDDNTLLRFKWRKGDFYFASISTESLQKSSQYLALLARDLGRVRSPNTFQIGLNIVNGTVIQGREADQLRSRGLKLSVVSVPGEPDNKSQRQQEIERRKRKTRECTKSRGPNKKPQHPRHAWQFFMKDFNIPAPSVRDAYNALSAQEKKLFEDKARADRFRFDKEKAKLKSATSFQIYCSEMATSLMQHPEYGGQEGRAKLTQDLKLRWKQLGAARWSEYEKKKEQLDVKRKALALGSQVC